MICKHCGKEIAKESIFCSFCGKKVFEEKPTEKDACSKNEASTEQVCCEDFGEEEQVHVPPKKTILYFLVALLLIVIPISYVFLNLQLKYSEAMQLLNKGEFEKAIVVFTNLKNYKNSPQMILESKYRQAAQMIETKDYSKAIELFNEIKGYKDSEDLYKESNYLLGKQYIADKNYSKAIEIFNKIKDYKDSNSLLAESTYLEATRLYTDGNFEAAEDLYMNVADYKDSEKYLKDIAILKKCQGTWETELQINRITITGWKIIYNDYISDRYTLENGKLKQGGFTYSLDSNNKLTCTFIGTDKKIYSVTYKPALRIGMTADEVLNSNWGKPARINRTITKYGVIEQWVYPGNKYIYLEDGVVRSIQE